MLNSFIKVLIPLCIGLYRAEVKLVQNVADELDTKVFKYVKSPSMTATKLVTLTRDQESKFFKFPRSIWDKNELKWICEIPDDSSRLYQYDRGDEKFDNKGFTLNDKERFLKTNDIDKPPYFTQTHGGGEFNGKQFQEVYITDASSGLTYEPSQHKVVVKLEIVKTPGSLFGYYYNIRYNDLYLSTTEGVTKAIKDVIIPSIRKMGEELGNKNDAEIVLIKMQADLNSKIDTSRGLFSWSSELTILNAAKDALKT